MRSIIEFTERCLPGFIQTHDMVTCIIHVFVLFVTFPIWICIEISKKEKEMEIN